MGGLWVVFAGSWGSLGGLGGLGWGKKDKNLGPQWGCFGLHFGRFLDAFLDGSWKRSYESQKLTLKDFLESVVTIATVFVK